MKNSSVNEELLCSLKDELRDVSAQIDACSESASSAVPLSLNSNT